MNRARLRRGGWLAVMLLALSCAVQAAEADQAAIVTVVMAHNRFEPDHLTLHAGKLVELRLENHDKDLHEFTALAFLHAARIHDKHQLASGGGDIVIHPGTMVTVLLVPGPEGTYELTCADHDWDGMTGLITVVP